MRLLLFSLLLNNISAEPPILNCFEPRQGNRYFGDSYDLCNEVEQENDLEECKNVFVICDSDESSSDFEINMANPKDVVRQILFLENMALQELKAEFLKEFKNLKTGVKAILSSSANDIVSSSVQCLDTLEKQTLNAVINTFNHLIPVVKKITDEEIETFNKAFVSTIMSVEAMVKTYIVYLQGIPAAATLQTLVKNNINGPNPTIIKMIDSIKSSLTPLLNSTAISISNKISKFIIEEREELALKLAKFFGSAVNSIKSMLVEVTSKEEMAFSSALNKETSNIIGKLTCFMGVSEQQILRIIASCLPKLANSSDFKIPSIESVCSYNYFTRQEPFMNRNMGGFNPTC